MWTKKKAICADLYIQVHIKSLKYRTYDNRIYANTNTVKTWTKNEHYTHIQKGTIPQYNQFKKKTLA